MVEVYVGTSGWLYDWNEDASFDWYVEYSGLNSVELNASFYRFPFRNQVLGWSRKGSSLRWSVKVHRSITHYRRFTGRAMDIWRRFYKLFEPLDEFIDFYLFQLPPNYTCREEYLERIEKFYRETGLEERFALEFRNKSCFNDSIVEWAKSLGLTLVSIDAPIAVWIVKSSSKVYVRMHGRTVWYGYEYDSREIGEVAKRAIELKPSSIYVFFNNNHWMLDNAREMMKTLKELSRGM